MYFKFSYFYHNKKKIIFIVWSLNQILTKEVFVLFNQYVYLKKKKKFYWFKLTIIKYGSKD